MWLNPDFACLLPGHPLTSNLVLLLPSQRILLDFSNMSPCRTAKSKQRRPPYSDQIVTAVVKISQEIPHDQICTFSESELKNQVRMNAKYNPRMIGKRFDHYIRTRLRALRDRGLIDADFGQEPIQITITPAGRRKYVFVPIAAFVRLYQSRFQDIEVDVGISYIDNEKAELDALFLAARKHVGPLKGLTNSQLGTMCDQKDRIIVEQDRTITELRKQVHSPENRAPVPTLPDEVRRFDISNAAGSSNSSQLRTPIRKAMSMGAYPTPDSLPQRRDPVPRSPPPSPSPRGSFTMDVDNDELSLQPTNHGLQDSAMQYTLPGPSPPENERELTTKLHETQEKLAEAQDQIAQLSARCQQYEEAIRSTALEYKRRDSELQDEIEVLRALHDEDNVVQMEMSQLISYLENQRDQEKVCIVGEDSCVGSGEGLGGTKMGSVERRYRRD
ncbi:hypothetical protein MVEN_00584500 [Mycena venus]|uniref:Uncharacterized protein n=1 Tax=Mycena venus TaxID=2733690 RepID=A0A8H6YPC3_9AGAR|nr:hypothetical protein MVEN_00584500 [Mycena venus]